MVTMPDDPANYNMTGRYRGALAIVSAAAVLFGRQQQRRLRNGSGKDPSCREASQKRKANRAQADRPQTEIKTAEAPVYATGSLVCNSKSLLSQRCAFARGCSRRRGLDGWTAEQPRKEVTATGAVETAVPAEER